MAKVIPTPALDKLVALLSTQFQTTDVSTISDKFNSVAIDVETLGVETGSVVCEVGLVFFNLMDPGWFEVSFSFHHDEKELPGADVGGYINISTLLYHQDKGTLGPLLQAMDEGYAVADVFGAIKFAFQSLFNFDIGRIYMRGKPFDRLQLEALAKRNDLGDDWFQTNLNLNHYHWVDGRDLLAPFKPYVPRVDPVTAHRAIDDAVALAVNVRNAHRYLEDVTKRFEVKEEGAETRL